MKYFLINEQDLYEYQIEIENIILSILDKIKEKEINEEDDNYDDGG